MDVILDELQKNNLEINMRTSSYYINYLTNHHAKVYNHLVTCINAHDLPDVFSEMNANNFGQIISKITWLYSTYLLIKKDPQKFFKCSKRKQKTNTLIVITFCMF